MTDKPNVRTKEQMQQRLKEIRIEIEAANPYDTFEPHAHEEGKIDILELYESRLMRLFYEKVFEDQELTRFLLNDIENELRREKN